MPEAYLPKPYHTRIWKAIYEHSLIEPDDKVLIGLSGGKDSMFMAYALSKIRSYSKIPFSLSAVTVELGFENRLNAARLREFCAELEIEYDVVDTRIADVIEAKSQQASPCAVCAYFRRAALHRFAKENGINKVAFAHHEDDAMETFLMNILFSGRVGVLPWKTQLSRTGVTVIRPLMYLPERDIRKAVRRLGIQPEPNVCPYSADTSRARTKQLIRDLSRENRMIRGNVISAMHQSDEMELWPSIGRHSKHEPS